MGKFIVFRLGEEKFGIEVGKVVEILKSVKPNAVPDMPEFVSGFIPVRGEFVPLVDMRKRFGIIPIPHKERSVLVRFGSEKVGLVVDEVIGILDFGAAEVTKPPAIFRGLKGKYIEGLGKKDDKAAILLNLNNILTSEEKLRLEKSKGTA